MTTRIAIYDLVNFVRHVEGQKGKYIKQIMRRLEEKRKLDPEIRKDILDGMNSFSRAVYHPWYDVNE